MGKIAGMGTRFLGLALVVGEQRVQFLDHGLDFQRQRISHPAGTCLAHGLDGATHPAQGAKAVPGLQPRHDEQAQAQDDKAVDKDRADTADLFVKVPSAGSHGEPPLRLAARQQDRPFDHPQRLAGELVAVIDVRLGVEMVAAHLKAAVPQRARREILVAGAPDLPVKAAVGLQKALVAERPVEEHLAVRADLGRGDHGGQHIAQLFVEIPRDQAVQRAIQRKAAQRQQDDDPSCRNQHHPLRKRTGVRLDRRGSVHDGARAAGRNARPSWPQPRPGPAGSSRL